MVAAPSTSSLNGSVITYFPICGRVEPVVYALEDYGIKYTHEGMGNFKEEKMNYDLFPFNQLPKVTLPSGKILVQQTAILRYILTTLGKGDSGNPDQDVDAWAFSCQVDDFMVDYVKRVYSPDATELLKPFASTQTDKVFAQFEHILKKSNNASGYFFYDYPSVGEYQFLYCIKCLLRLRPNVLEGFPRIAAWYDTMQGREGLKAYAESGREPKELNATPVGNVALC